MVHPTKEIMESWPAPNFVDPVTRGPELTVVNIIFIILVFVVVGLSAFTITIPCMLSQVSMSKSRLSGHFHYARLESFTGTSFTNC